jgi:hypothetical protein
MTDFESHQGEFSLNREPDGWRLWLKADNGAQVSLFFPDAKLGVTSDPHLLYLDTFARNARKTPSRSWRVEGMEGL